LNDAKRIGFSARTPSWTPDVDAVLRHIVHGNTHSPFVSLSRSFAVAAAYARDGRHHATQGNPGFVYEIHLDRPLPGGLELYDPIVAISGAINDPLSNPSYHHDGDQNLLLGLVSRGPFAAYRSQSVQHPPGSGAASRSVTITNMLEALVYALRDAEILAAGTIPSGRIVTRHQVW
jgi:hypothetical protein